MNTCLYKIGFSGYFSRSCSVIDVYINSPIISYKVFADFTNFNKKISLDDQEKYDKFLLSEKDLTGDGDCKFQYFDDVFKKQLNPKS